MIEGCDGFEQCPIGGVLVTSRYGCFSSEEIGDEARNKLIRRKEKEKRDNDDNDNDNGAEGRRGEKLGSIYTCAQDSSGSDYPASLRLGCKTGFSVLSTEVLIPRCYLQLPNPRVLTAMSQIIRSILRA